jgi:hypothetical protein
MHNTNKILSNIYVSYYDNITVKTFIHLKNQYNMKVAVWDTYVTKKDGSVMHFDIIVPESMKDTDIIIGYGRDYLITKGQNGQQLTSKECRFCHVERAKPEWEVSINKFGYYIYEMDNC